LHRATGERLLGAHLSVEVSQVSLVLSSPGRSASPLRPDARFFLLFLSLERPGMAWHVKTRNMTDLVTRIITHTVIFWGFPIHAAMSSQSNSRTPLQGGESWPISNTDLNWVFVKTLEGNGGGCATWGNVTCPCYSQGSDRPNAGASFTTKGEETQAELHMRKIERCDRTYLFYRGN
jgi:hypothetical protein